MRIRQRRVPVNLADLQKFAQRALQTCRETAPSRKLTSDDITVVIISDRRMAELHERFMNIAGPTDVITFQHGEIFISAETAQRNARRFRNSFARELQLYLVHGLLHLHGFDRWNTGAIAADESAAKQHPAKGESPEKPGTGCLNWLRRMLALLNELSATAGRGGVGEARRQISWERI